MTGRRTSKRRLLAILVAAIALAMPAQAAWAGEARHGRWIDLRFPSQAGDASCTSRQIELGFGTYSWTLDHQFAGFADVLGSLTTAYYVPWREYEWTDCIVHYGTGYRHTAYLYSPAANGAPAASYVATPYVFYHAASTRLVTTWFGSRLERG